MYEIKKRTVKEVFGHWKRKLFKICADLLYHSFPLLMGFCGSSLDYGIIVNILCAYLCRCTFSYRLNLKAFFKT